ncbi:hypothetical protein ABC389_03680 [Limosilactobacillus sp. WILCCON 0053]|uniref:hypothetical protein n=1 Tax=Limosilactobacillus allomucosae TaxID=3142938 RepID=UPI0032645DE3
MIDSPYRTLDDNWKWYKDNYTFEYRTKDLLDGTVKPEDQARYDEFCAQIKLYRGNDAICEQDTRSPHWFARDRIIARKQREALRKGRDISWVKAQAGISDSTYNRHVYLSQEVNMLHEKLKERGKRKANDSKATICIDMQTYKRYEFDSRIDCDRYFDWPTGTASMMVITKKHYHHRYWIFDKEDEEKTHGEV